MQAWLRDCVRCPTCRGPLHWDMEAARCGDCPATYPYRQGVPSFVPPPEEAAPSDDAHDRLRRNPVLRRAIPPDPGLDIGRTSRRRRFLSLLPPAARALDLGSRRDRIASGWAHMDLLPAPGLDFAGDAAALPLADRCLHACRAVSLLEHVPDPLGVLGEIHRVLVPDGLVYVETPFLFPYHPDPGDYRRYTPEGLADELRASGFTPLEHGHIGGPASVLCAILPEVFACFFRSFLFYNATKFLLGWFAQPIKLLDVFLTRNPRAARCAQGSWVLARKDPDDATVSAEPPR